MENWRLRDMIWNFTPALKFAFIWPEYLAIVLIFLISQFNPFWSFSKSTCKETKLKIVQCDWPSVWECQPSELWSQRLQDISTPNFSTRNFSIMNTYFNQELFNHEYFNHELFNHEHYNPEIFNHEHFNPRQLFIVKSGVEPWGSKEWSCRLKSECWKCS